MRQPLERFLVDTNFMGLPLFEAGALEMKAAVSVAPLTAEEQQHIIQGQDRMLAEFRRRDSLVSRETNKAADQSLAGAAVGTGGGGGVGKLGSFWK